MIQYQIPDGMGLYLGYSEADNCKLKRIKPRIL